MSTFVRALSLEWKRNWRDRYPLMFFLTVGMLLAFMSVGVNLVRPSESRPFWTIMGFVPLMLWLRFPIIPANARALRPFPLLPIRPSTAVASEIIVAILVIVSTAWVLLGIANAFVTKPIGLLIPLSLSMLIMPTLGLRAVASIKRLPRIARGIQLIVALVTAGLGAAYFAEHCTFVLSSAALAFVVTLMLSRFEEAKTARPSSEPTEVHGPSVRSGDALMKVQRRLLSRLWLAIIVGLFVTELMQFVLDHYLGRGAKRTDLGLMLFPGFFLGGSLMPLMIPGASYARCLARLPVTGERLSRTNLRLTLEHCALFAAIMTFACFPSLRDQWRLHLPWLLLDVSVIGTMTYVWLSGLAVPKAARLILYPCLAMIFFRSSMTLLLSRLNFPQGNWLLPITFAGLWLAVFATSRPTNWGLPINVRA